jgi:hypothetical protein
MQGIFFSEMAVLPCEIGLSSPATVTTTSCSEYVFKMAVSIQNSATYKVRAVIRFLHAKREIAAVYGEDVMNRQNVAKW